jgi:lambda repressor-like predicted transcriptional regulator
MDHPTLRDLASAVREAIQASGLSVNETADRSNVPRTTLKRHLIDGKFGSDELPAVAAALGTTPSALWTAAEAVAA